MKKIETGEKVSTGRGPCQGWERRKGGGGGGVTVGKDRSPTLFQMTLLM